MSLIELLLLLLLLPIAAAFAPRTEIRQQQKSLLALHAAAPPVFGILGRLRGKRKVDQRGTIAPGTAIEDVDVEQLVIREDGTSEHVAVSVKEVLGSNKTMLVGEFAFPLCAAKRKGYISTIVTEKCSHMLLWLGMPGAFTPTCSKEHFPGYIKNAETFGKLGIDKICIVTTNDRFVNEEWMATQGAHEPNSKITMLSDGDGDLVKSLGLAEDMGFGFDVRSKRFVIVAEDGVVSSLFTDEGMDDCSATKAENVIEALSPKDVGEEMELSPAALGGIVGAIGLVFAGLMFGGGGGGDSSGPRAPSPTATTRTMPAKKNPYSDSRFSLLEDYGKEI